MAPKFHGVATLRDFGGTPCCPCWRGLQTVMNMKLSVGRMKLHRLRSLDCVSMALRDVTNVVGSYVAQIQMDKKYALSLGRGRLLKNKRVVQVSLHGE